MRPTFEEVCLKVLVVVLGWSAIVSVYPSQSRNYDDLQQANPFRLRPAAPIVHEGAPPPPAPPQELELFLTGLTTLTPEPVAYLMTRDAKGEKKYYGLAEGEARDGMEVLDIDVEGKRIKVKSFGQEILLSFDTHGIKPPKNPGPAPAPVPPVQTANAPGQQNASSGYGGQPGNRPQRVRAPFQGADPIQLSRNSRIPRGSVRNLRADDVAVGFVSGPSADVVIHTRVQPPPDMSEEQVAMLAELQAQAGTGVGYLPTPGTPETLHRSSLSYPGQVEFRGVDVYMPEPPMIDGGDVVDEP